MELDVGDIIDGKYRIVRLLGQGGMGNVYEGENERIKRRVAIKVLNADASKNAEIVSRFEREAQAAARIGSQHIVDVLDLGEFDSGDRYMVMEYLDGESLDDRLKRQATTPPDELFRIVVELLEALHEAHEVDIVHRDLKPHNVFLLSEDSGMPDFIKILDFGVSKFRDGGDAEAMQMTKTGALLGTPYYMAPEQARAERDIDRRADLFSVGVILFRGISGRVPFDTPVFHELLFKLALEDAPTLDTIVPSVDPEVSRIVAKALARDPDERYPDALAFADDLRGWLADNDHDAPVQSKRVRQRRSQRGQSDPDAASSSDQAQEGASRELSLGEGADGDNPTSGAAVSVADDDADPMASTALDPGMTPLASSSDPRAAQTAPSKRTALIAIALGAAAGVAFYAMRGGDSAATDSQAGQRASVTAPAVAEPQASASAVLAATATPSTSASAGGEASAANTVAAKTSTAAPQPDARGASPAASAPAAADTAGDVASPPPSATSPSPPPSKTGRPIRRDLD